jgi:hypothetical protein
MSMQGVRRRATRLCVCALIAALSAGVGPVASSAAGQSLADVAAREQQRRQKVKSTSKVYTNQDLGPGGEAAQQPSQAPSATPPTGQVAGPGGAETGASAVEGQTPADPAKAEAEWRGRIEGARAQLQRNELFLEALQSRVNGLTTDFVNRDDPAQRALIGNDRQRALREMERVRSTIEALKQQIADIEEEARRAGVPPGWLR